MRVCGPAGVIGRLKGKICCLNQSLSLGEPLPTPASLERICYYQSLSFSALTFLHYAHLVQGHSD